MHMLCFEYQHLMTGNMFYIVECFTVIQGSSQERMNATLRGINMNMKLYIFSHSFQF